MLSRIPALKTWFRTSRAVVMHLTNGTMQINFFKVRLPWVLDNGVKLIGLGKIENRIN